MNIVKIFGHDYKLQFNMATQIEYEELSGNLFDVESPSMTTQKGTLQLCYAALKASNGELPFTYEQMTGAEEYEGHNGITVTETIGLKNALFAEMNKWFEIPGVMRDEVESESKGADPKNA